MRSTRGAATVGLAVVLAGCAPALPSLLGGRTTPEDRTDLALGGAVRVPVGEMVPEGVDVSDELLRLTSVGGVVPVAFVRHGVTRDVDLAVEAAGSTLRLGVRGQLRLPRGLVLMAGLTPHVGAAVDDGAAVRFGGSLPVGLAIDLFSLIEAWLAARVAVEHAVGEVGSSAAARSASVTGLRTGGVVGIAVGFRRVHVLLELGVDHELWLGSVGDTSIGRTGVVLTPAFALRIRL